MADTTVSDFLKHHYRHFNAAALIDAAEGYVAHVDAGGKMLVSLAGAMSTAELGLSLAEMIRRDLVHVISCTGANLEEDLFNLVAHDHYERVPNYRDLTPADEQALLERGMNRVTDTCIPEEEAFRRLEGALVDEWHAMEAEGRRAFPHEVLYRILKSGRLEEFYQIDPKDSWLVAAAEKDLPIVTPGWEDSHDGQHLRLAHPPGRHQEPAPRQARHRVHDVARGLVHGQHAGRGRWRGRRAGHRVLPDRRRHRRRLPDLRRADAGAGHGPPDTAVGLLRAGLGLDDELRLVLGRGPEREDHLGQARRGDAEVHRRERRDDRGAADLPDRAGDVSARAETPAEGLREDVLDAEASEAAAG